MFFALTDEQRALADSVRGLLADRFSVGMVRAACYDDPESDGIPAELWKAVGEQGWLAVLVPEEYDGLGLGLLDAAVVARCFGASVVPGPWLSTVLAGEALRLAGSPEQARAWLPRVATGEARLGFAFRGPFATWDSSGLGVTADPEGRLSGELGSVEYPAAVDAFVVAARMDGAGPEGDADTPGGRPGVGLFLVPAGAVSVEPRPALDRSTRLGDVGLRAAPAQRLPGGSAEVFDELLDRAAVLVAADLVGLSREALTRTVRYDAERTQFGRPVGSFQALQHALADLHVGVTMAEHGVLYAAHALDEKLPDAGLAVSVAKGKASDVARDVAAAMVQFHGGIGFTWEHDTHLFFKRAKRQEYSFGDGAFHRERIARRTVDTAP